jgi:hypothetical protein
MPRMTLQKLADMMELGFTEILCKLGMVQEDVIVMKKDMKNLKAGQERLERNLEDVNLKLDNKADKIDFPEVYPQFKNKKSSTR